MAHQHKTGHSVPFEVKLKGPRVKDWVLGDSGSETHKPHLPQLGSLGECCKLPRALGGISLLRKHI